MMRTRSSARTAEQSYNITDNTRNSKINRQPFLNGCRLLFIIDEMISYFIMLRDIIISVALEPGFYYGYDIEWVGYYKAV
jgi:hypothetical protein